MRYLEGHEGPICAVAFSPDGRTLASAGQHGSVFLWDLTGTNSARQLVPSDQTFPPATTVAYHPQGKMFAWGDAGASVNCFRLPENTSHWRIESDLGAVSSVSFVNAGKQILVGYGDRINPSAPGGTCILNAENGKVIRQLGAQHGTLAVAAEQLGKRILWGGGDRRVTVLDLTAQGQATTPAHNREVRALALSPDGTCFAAADDYIIRLYETASRRELRQLSGHKGRVDALAFSHDGRFLISGAWDQHVKVWDVDRGVEIAAHDWSIGKVRSIALAADGLTGAAAGDRGIIALWDLDG